MFTLRIHKPHKIPSKYVHVPWTVKDREFYRVPHATKAGFGKHLEMLRPEGKEDDPTSTDPCQLAQLAEAKAIWLSRNEFMMLKYAEIKRET